MCDVSVLPSQLWSACNDCSNVGRNNRSAVTAAAPPTQAHTNPHSRPPQQLGLERNKSTGPQSATRIGNGNTDRYMSGIYRVKHSRNDCDQPVSELMDEPQTQDPQSKATVAKIQQLQRYAAASAFESELLFPLATEFEPNARARARVPVRVPNQSPVSNGSSTASRR